MFSLASERSERDTYRGKNEKIGDVCLFIYWRASVASETLTGVTQSKIGDVSLFIWRASVASETLTGVTQSKIGDVCLFIYLFIYIYGRTYVILYFDPRVFVLVMCSTPSQIALNRILWFIDQYPYHPRN